MISRHFSSRPLRAALIACSLFGLSACVRYQPHPISPEKSAADFSARSLNDEGLRRFLAENLGQNPPSWPMLQWDFEPLVLAAYYFQPGLEVARAEWRVAMAGKTTAGERPNPTLGLSGTYDTTTPPPWIPAVTFDIPIETGRKRGYRLAQAQHLAEAARWNLYGAVWQVRSGVRAALLDLFSARETQTLLARQEAAQAEVVRLLDGQRAAGAVAGVEVTQARIALETSQLGRQQAARENEEALARLADALGVPVAALAEAALSFAGLDEFPTRLTAPEVRRGAILNRTDIRGALAEYSASQSALQLAIASQFPDLNLGPGYEFDQTDNKWTLGVSLALPLLNQNQGAIAEARAKRELAAAHFLEVQSKAAGQIDLALAAYQAALRQAATAAALLDNLQKALDSVRGMQQAGEADPLAVASAQVAFSAGALARLDALVKAQRALGQLEDAVQSPLVLSPAMLHHAEANPRETQAAINHEP
ncbi:MAG TPA: TolC family protein [Opitutaceae bacterium]|nr:TolC family protein [Opitutaceae bacterium]